MDTTIVDIGGGASLLVDGLLRRGYEDVIVVDVSQAALDVVRARLGPDADHVTWIAADVRQLRLPRPVDVWHDRAVFHFLTDEEDREAYVEALRNALRPKGYVIIATFAPAGPERCSGLPVERYDAQTIADLLGPDFELVQSFEKQHVTPSGSGQLFTYAVFRRLR